MHGSKCIEFMTINSLVDWLSIDSCNWLIDLINRTHLLPGLRVAEPAPVPAWGGSPAVGHAFWPPTPRQRPYFQPASCRPGTPAGPRLPLSALGPGPGPSSTENGLCWRSSIVCYVAFQPWQTALICWIERNFSRQICQNFRAVSVKLLNFLWRTLNSSLTGFVMVRQSDGHRV